MYVNFYGGFQTFTYIPYMYAMDPEMLDPTYWENKVGIVGASLAGLSDFRNTPVAEAFVGVEIHANVMYSVLKNEFVKLKSQSDKFKTILILSIVMGIFISFPKKPLYALPIPIIGIVSWIIFTRVQFGGSLITVSYTHLRAHET